MLFLSPVILGILFLSGRNYNLQGSCFPLAMNPGNVFFDGNNPLTIGTTGEYPPVVMELASGYTEEGDYQHEIYRVIARRVSGSDLTVGESNRFWAGKALAVIYDYPDRFLEITGRRLFHLFHSYRWHDLDVAWNAGQELRKYSFPFLPFAVISALALFGLILKIRSWRSLLLPYAIYIIQATVIALTFATDRQRVSLFPFFVFFSVMGLTALHQARFRVKAIAVAGFLLLLPLFSLDSSRMQDDRHIWNGFSKTYAFVTDIGLDRAALSPNALSNKTASVWAASPRLIEAGRPAGIPAGQTALAAEALHILSTGTQETPSLRLDRAMLMIAAGRLNDAESVLGDLVQQKQDFSLINGRIASPSYYLGNIALLQGRRDEAVRKMSEALQELPGNPVILAHLACLTGEESYSSRIFRYYDDIDAHYFLGRACLETGDPEKARQHLKQLSRYLPDYPKGQIYLAAALGATSSDAEAAGIYMATTGGRSDMVILDDLILPVFARLAKKGSPESVYWHGLVLRQYGQLADALKTFKQAEKAGSTAASQDRLELEGIISGLPRN